MTKLILAAMLTAFFTISAQAQVVGTVMGFTNADSQDLCSIINLNVNGTKTKFHYLPSDVGAGGALAVIGIAGGLGATLTVFPDASPINDTCLGQHIAQVKAGS